MRTIIALMTTAAVLFSYAACHAITIEQVTRGHELIEKISSEKKALDEVKSADCDDKQNWFTKLTYYVRAKVSDSECNPCSAAGGGNWVFSNGYNPNEHIIGLGLDRKHVIAAMQSQLDDDMAELNKLGITP